MTDPIVQHTPGPWRWNAQDGTLLDLEDAEGRLVLGAFRCDSCDRGEEELCYWPTEADSRLIAAAPDLLAALDGVMKHRTTVADCQCVHHEAARAAINAATGSAVPA